LNQYELFFERIFELYVLFTQLTRLILEGLRQVKVHRESKKEVALLTLIVLPALCSLTA